MRFRPKLCCSIFLSGLLAGCGDGLSVTTSAPTDIVFTEDADPAVAALAFVEDELLVQPYPGADGQSLASLYLTSGAQVLETLDDIDATLLRVEPDERTAVAFRLAESGLIETVQKNYIYDASRVPNDPLFSQQEHLSRIGAVEAWDLSRGGEDIIIAIVDTGVDPNHPDLVGKIIDGWNVVDDTADFSDTFGHGTAVAGVAAASTDNGLGVAGVAWNSPILAVRSADDQGRSTARALAAGILWAAANGARVINVSFAPLRVNRIIRSAAQSAANRGALVVISAGNAGKTSKSRGFDDAIFVAAVDASDQAAFFSDRGPFVDLAAPGVAIRSTELGGDYGFSTGTSFSAPIVSGLAALVLSIKPTLRPATVEEILTDTAIDLGAAGKDSSYGHGMVRAFEAVSKAASTNFVPDTLVPTVSVAAPAAGAKLWGRFLAEVNATDSSGVADVVMFIDGVPFATDRREPYRFAVDTARFDVGTHELSFVATDRAGNGSGPASVTVSFQPPFAGTRRSTQIQFTFPDPGTVVSGEVTIRATVSDSDGLATIEWFVDGVPTVTGTLSGVSSGVSYRWGTSGVDAGEHRIVVVITDASGDRTSGRLELSTQ